MYGDWYQISAPTYTKYGEEHRRCLLCGVIEARRVDKLVEPTAVPTVAPTAVPTVAPTESPTAVPTEVPTAVPTEVPTAVPTEAPTAVPTEEPTAAPTVKPTLPPVDDSDDVPKTGDNHFVTSMFVMVAMAFAAAYLGLRVKARKEN